MRLIAIILVSSVQISLQTNQIFHAPLNGDGSISFSWVLDYSSKSVVFEVHLPENFGWFAIGFSDYGKHFPADYCLLWNDMKRELRFEDTWADTKGILHLDKQQDCRKFKLKVEKNRTKFTFRRDFDTCDFEDYIIEDGTTHVVWARGPNPLYKLAGLNISSPEKDQGMVRVQLLKNTNVEAELPSHVKTLDVLAHEVRVPEDETTYWCHVHKLEPEFIKKHHVYRVRISVVVSPIHGFLQYEAHIPKSSEGLVHHMEVFHCVAPPDQEIPRYVGNCFAKERPKETQVCKRVLAAWAMGAPAFTYPEVGIIINFKLTLKELKFHYF